MQAAIRTIFKKETTAGIIIGAFLMVIWNSYAYSNREPDPSKTIVQQGLADDANAYADDDILNDSTVLLKNGQVVLERKNCTTAEYSPANVMKVNGQISNNGPWPYIDSSEVCAGENSKNCFPPLPENPDRLQLYTSRTSKTAICTVRKSSSRISISISCMLDDPLKFFYGKQDLIENVFESFCQTSNRHRSIKSAEKAGVTNKNGWKLAMVIREPLERFVSGFLHLCMNGRIDEDCNRYCNGCGVDINCFLDRQTKKFEDMLKFHSNVDDGSNHFYPQNWACDLRNHIGNYTFLNFHSDSAKFFDESLRPFFKSQNVGDDALNYIRDRMVSTRTKHANTTPELAIFLQNKIRSSPQLLEKFLRIYYHDYTTFGYPIPELLKE
ncbi:hypothetical protein M3Y97_00963600 [Aphelenchoides bicaudatus]|nr:hypothetical protein M3Y97_00963600 [Aphelenchoides bicaudatus]